MNGFPIFSAAILAILIALLIVAIPAIKVKREEFQKTGKHPKGHYLGLGMAFGLALGLPLGIAMDNIALGPGMGLPIGLAIGAALEKKHEKELRPLTEAEEKIRNHALMLALAILVLGAIAGLALFYFSR